MASSSTPLIHRHWMHSLRIPLGQLRVGSHRLRIETDHHIPRSDRICQMCHLQEPETEMHLIFRCPIYYEIRGRYHCLYRDSGGSLSTFFRYQDQRCLALFIREIFSHRSQFLHAMPRLGMTRTITSYFHVDPSDRSNKRRAESQSAPDNRLVRPRVSPQPPPLGDRPISSRPVRRCRTVHQSIHPQRVRGINSRQIQSRAPPVRQITSQIQRSSQRSIQSFFLSTSDARSIPRSYIPPGSYSRTPRWFQRTPTASQCPVRPPRPRPSDPGDLDIISLIVRSLSHSLSLDRLLSCPLFQSWTNSLSILYHRTFVTVIYMYFEAVLLQVSFFMLFSAFSRRCACTPTLYSYLLYSSVPLTYFCGHLLDINKIILSYLTGFYRVKRWVRTHMHPSS
jgi:hypothetical protein